jgi:hypothetical protein
MPGISGIELQARPKGGGLRFSVIVITAFPDARVRGRTSSFIGIGTRVSAISCLEVSSRQTNGLPVRLALTAGEAHDNRLADKLLSRLKSGSMLLADRGYDADWLRAFVARKGTLASLRQPGCGCAIRSGWTLVCIVSR